MRPRKSNCRISRSERVGRRVHVFDDEDVLILLRAEVEREGSQAAFAKRRGIDDSYVSLLLNGKCSVGPLIIDVLGLKKVYARK